MLGLPRWLAIAAALLLVVAIDWQSSLFSCIGKQAIEQPGESQKADKGNEKGCSYNGFVSGPIVAFFHSIEWTSEAVTAAATIIIAAFTVILGIAAYFQYRMMKAGLDDTRILQRAYLSVELRGINPWRTTPDLLSCDFAFVNSGNLPATEVGWALKRKFSGVRMLDDFADIRGEPFVGKHVIIRPKGEMIKSAEPLPRQELGAEVARHAGKVYLYIYGRVRYIDGFGDSRIIGFCHRYNVNDVGPEGVGAKFGRQHEYGNYTEK